MASHSMVERMSLTAGCSCPPSDCRPVTSGSRPHGFYQPQRDGGRRRMGQPCAATASSNGVWAKGGHPRKPLKKQSPKERSKGSSGGQLVVEKRPPSAGGGRRQPPGMNKGQAELAALKVQVPSTNGREQVEGATRNAVRDSVEDKLEHFVGVWGAQNKAPLGLETNEERELRLQKLGREEKEKLQEEMLRFSPAYGRTELTGQHRQASSGQLATFLWSRVADETGYMQRTVAQRTLAYERTLDAMAPELTRYFFVFARSIQRRVIPSPWEDWTLVAQLAVESASAIDTSVLPGQLAAREQALVAECVQWCRPDLMLRRRPQFKIRIEEQEPFFRALPHLLTPSRGANFYDHLCTLLGVPNSASLEQVEIAYQRATAGTRSQVWEAVFSENPGNPLRDVPDETDGLEKSPHGGERDAAARADGEGSWWSAREEARGEGVEAKWEEEEEGEDESDKIFDVEGEALSEREPVFGDDSEDDEGSDNEREDGASLRGPSSKSEGDGVEAQEGLRVAIRPFDYTNLLKEIVFVQDFVLHVR